MPSKKRKRILTVSSSSEEEDYEQKTSGEIPPTFTSKDKAEKRRRFAKRSRVLCPVSGCNKKIVHLPVHLRNVHGQPWNMARYGRIRNNLRKDTRRLAAPKYKDYHIRTNCPVPDCYAAVKRMSDHLKKEHKLNELQQIVEYGAQPYNRKKAESAPENGPNDTSLPTSSNEPVHHDFPRKYQQKEKYAFAFSHSKANRTPEESSSRLQPSNNSVDRCFSSKKSLSEPRQKRAETFTAVRSLKTSQTSSRTTSLEISSVRPTTPHSSILTKSQLRKSFSKSAYGSSQSKSNRTPGGSSSGLHSVKNSFNTSSSGSLSKAGKIKPVLDNKNSSKTINCQTTEPNHEVDVTKKYDTRGQRKESIVDYVDDIDCDSDHDPEYIPEKYTCDDDMFYSTDDENGDALPETGLDLDMPETGVDLDMSETGVDLDMPETGVDLDMPETGVDLDMPETGVDLDMPETGVDLDMPETGVDLDMPETGVDIDMPETGVDLDMPETGVDIDMPETGADLEMNGKNPHHNETISAEHDSEEIVCGEVDYDSDTSAKEFPTPHKPWSWLRKKLCDRMNFVRNLDSETFNSHLRTIEFMYESQGSDNYRLLFNINNSSKIISNMRKHVSGHKHELIKVQSQKKYITALKYLANYFVVNPKIDLFCTPARLQPFLQSLEDFSKSKRKQLSSEVWQRHERDARRIPKEEDIGSYFDCPLRKENKEMLKEITETDKSAALYVKDYMIIMGYLFLEVSFQNANRAGEARNMTYKEFLEGKVMEDNSLLINVSLHKVNYKYGSSPVVISPSLHTELRTYVEKIRPEPRKNCNNFFLSSVGGEISISSMPRIMKNYWEKTGLSGEVNASLLRKASVTFHFSLQTKNKK